jgi:hypothetical protein
VGSERQVSPSARDRGQCFREAIISRLDAHFFSCLPYRALIICLLQERQPAEKSEPIFLFFQLKQLKELKQQNFFPIEKKKAVINFYICCQWAA